VRSFGFFRRRKNRLGQGGSPTRWRAVPFDMPPAPERGAVMQRVQRLTESLEGAIDEGTGASLDLLIESWARSWIAIVETEHVDHCAVISVHRGQAQQWLAETTATAQHEREELGRVQMDYLASRQRLTGELTDPTLSSAPLARGIQDPEHNAGPGVPTTDATVLTPGPGPGRDATPSTGSVPRPDWTAPHLVADRSRVGLLLVGILILIGALADTVVFKNILELILRQESAAVAWLLAAGATSMALVAAGSVGVALAIRRRGRHFPLRYRPSRLPLIGSAVVWLALGLAMFLIRWQDNAATGVPTFGSTSTPAQSTLWVAMFFAAIYLISGACTMFEAERLYNPEYFAFRRLSKRFRKQAERVAKANAKADRARAALDLHDGELDREDQSWLAAIADRKALAAEAANYARILMASMMRDPAKTGITETGPVPETSSPPGGQPPARGLGVA
jgi:hypothetical protein